MRYINYAAYLPSPNAPLEVATAPLPSLDTLGDDEIIVKTHAVAVNPVDWKVRDAPPGQNRFGITYPFILGEDVAGEVVHAGAGARAGVPGSSTTAPLAKGDRVLGYAMGLGAGDTAYGGFQLYVKLRAAAVARIPPGLSYERAAVLPLSVSTAAAGLYMAATLGLRLPPSPSSSLQRDGDDNDDSRGWSDEEKEKKKNKGTLLVWGGSSSVGSSVVQLAAASGYAVVATASPANYGYVRGLGADLVLDYHNPDIVEVLTLVLRGAGGGVVGAYDAIGTEATVRQNAAVLAAVGGSGDGRLRVASVGVVVDLSGDDGDVEVVRVGATGIVDKEPEVARRVWGEYLPAALASGAFKPAPKETVVGRGLYYCQGALDLNKRGVSASKVVVQL